MLSVQLYTWLHAEYSSFFSKLLLGQGTVYYTSTATMAMTSLKNTNNWQLSSLFPFFRHSQIGWQKYSICSIDTKRIFNAIENVCVLMHSYRRLTRTKSL